jgi:uncharacterized membrane protein
MKISHLSNKKIPKGEEVKGFDIREGIFNLIRNDFPQFDKEDYISVAELNKYRRHYLTYLVREERGELAQLDKDVIEAINNNEILSGNILDELDSELTFGERIADKVASFGGSWAFIISFFLFVFIWMSINIWAFAHGPFDPYPFILLNLILSCLAAIQAPVIIMSQNRQEQKDRQRAEHDYKINLKSELEIKLLSEKIDYLMVNQSKKLLEIQEIQTDYLDDLMKELKKMK